MSTTTTQVKERPILFSGEMVRAILDGRKTQTRRVVKPQPKCFSHADWPESPDFVPHFNEDGSLCCGVCMGTQQRLTKKDVTGIRNPYGKPGDRLWVRETHSILDGRPEVTDVEHGRRPDGPCLVHVTYVADDAVATIRCHPSDWRESFDTDHIANRPSIHMPRWASRLTLEITDVRVERLQDISEADAVAEGIEPWGVKSFDSHCNPLSRGWKDYGAVRYASGPGYHCNPITSYFSLWESINGPGSWDASPWVWAISFARVEATPQ